MKINIARNRVQVKVPATSGNLGPGFDVLGIALSLYNELEIICNPKEKENKRSSVEFVISGEGANSLWMDERNIIWQAARKVFKIRQFPVENYQFRLNSVNQIPLARGLGSSSAAILSGLLAANALTGSALSEEELLNLASEMEGHPDNVVPALVGGLTIADETKGKVAFIRLEPPRDLCSVVCVPQFELSTAKARSVLPKQVSFQDALFNVKKVSRFLGAIVSKNYEHLKEAMEDRLHQPYRKKLVPGFSKVVENGYSAGALGITLSGAGPSILALVKEEKAIQVARAMEKAFLEAGKKSKSLILNFDKKGSSVK